MPSEPAEQKNEYRKDYLLERWVIVTANRGKRPQEFIRKTGPKEEEHGTCFFCPGNENLTPPEIDRVGDGHGGWLVRCFPNKFNAVDLKFPKAYGSHEIIVETPEHGARLSDLTARQLESTLGMYVKRTNALMRNRKIKYVMIFKNEGANAGASLMHTHTQLVSMDRVPPAVAEKLAAMKKNKSFSFEKVWKAEKKARERVIYENDHFIAFAPYSSRFAFEITLMAKGGKVRLVDFDGKELKALAGAMHEVLGKLDRLLNRPDYNYYLHSAPSADKKFAFHMEICPRLNVWAGLEFGAEVYLNSMAPEKAAAALREV
ncbi:MAG: DUF4931 domain-containing protein [Candidatus Micrarchaeia archaeon]|jgi:UDPglucose--hexose-1-phosphate uridylyltransferase